MDFYIPKEDVVNSISYFKELELDNDDNLFLFLMMKQAGISITYPVTVSGSNLSSEQKNPIYIHCGNLLAFLI